MANTNTVSDPYWGLFNLTFRNHGVNGKPNSGEFPSPSGDYLI